LSFCYELIFFFFIFFKRGFFLSKILREDDISSTLFLSPVVLVAPVGISESDGLVFTFRRGVFCYESRTSEVAFSLPAGFFDWKLHVV